MASESQIVAAASWRHTFMVEYSGGGAPELVDSDAVQAEATFEDRHWFHSMSFLNDVIATATNSSFGTWAGDSVYPAYYNASCGASASDELSIWGKCSCVANFGRSTKVHDQSPCDSVRHMYLPANACPSLLYGSLAIVAHRLADWVVWLTNAQANNTYACIRTRKSILYTI
eukprot:SAG31_NODE_4013_length_3665_cov_2.254907_4_plen_172_part_00